MALKITGNKYSGYLIKQLQKYSLCSGELEKKLTYLKICSKKPFS